MENVTGEIYEVFQKEAKIKTKVTTTLVLRQGCLYAEFIDK